MRRCSNTQAHMHNDSAAQGEYRQGGLTAVPDDSVRPYGAAP
jgi:hypothetical protein